MHTLEIREKKPPMGAATRWAGILPMVSWVNENMEALLAYDSRHPRDCALLDYGTNHKDYVLGDEDWEVLAQLVGLPYLV